MLAEHLFYISSPRQTQYIRPKTRCTLVRLHLAHQIHSSCWTFLAHSFALFKCSRYALLCAVQLCSVTPHSQSHCILSNGNWFLERDKLCILCINLMSHLLLVNWTWCFSFLFSIVISTFSSHKIQYEKKESHLIRTHCIYFCLFGMEPKFMSVHVHSKLKKYWSKTQCHINCNQGKIAFAKRFEILVWLMCTYNIHSDVKEIWIFEFVWIRWILFQDTLI